MTSDIDRGNILLGQLDQEVLRRLAPLMTRVPLELRQVLAEAEQDAAHAWFIESGVASVVARSETDERTEVGIVGREGFAPHYLILGTDRSPHETFVQIGGGTALRIATDDLRAALADLPGLDVLLRRYLQTFLVQSAQNTACNAHDRMEARLARWLLMCHDRVDGDDLALTHEFMAMMVAAQRSGVTVSLHILEGMGMIRSTRGLVTIRDRARLMEVAGSAYGAPEAEYRRMIGPFGKSA